MSEFYDDVIKKLEAKFESCNRARQAAEAENKKLKADKEALEQQLKDLKELVKAVNNTAYEGLECFDVNGVNWFDAREQLLKGGVK